MNEGESWDAIPEELLTDCAQLTKANSIEGKYSGKFKLKFSFLQNIELDTKLSTTGNKKDNVTIIYTPWSNLKKNGSMAVGQVGFKDPRMVRIGVHSEAATVES